MPPDPPALSKNEVEFKLQQLRDFPVNTAGTQDEEMLALHASLMRVKPGPDGVLHWFCPRAESLTQELATFLLRLHAYSNVKVDEWRIGIQKVWSRCSDCIRCMDEVKETSRTTYFGAFSDDTISKFWVNFEKYEVQAIVDALTKANITPDSDKSLADASSPLLYHILSKPAALGNAFILNIISSHPFLPRAVDWPMDPPPPGYFLLVVHEDKDIRDWAAEHVAKAKPVPREKFVSNYELALQILLNRLAGMNASAESLSSLARQIDAAFPFSKSQRDIWSGFSSILQLITIEVYGLFGLHRMIMGHLHDNGPHFREVLRCMLQTTKKLSSKLWAGESADYPQVVFDSIKDNPSYTGLILAHDPAQKEQPWFLLFFIEYLRSVWDMPIFGDIVAKFAAFTCDELQHERFEKKRPFVMSVAMQTLSAALKRASKFKSVTHRDAIMDVLDIHYDFIIAVSVSREYSGSHWTIARQQAIDLVRNVLLSDVEQLVNAVVGLSPLEPTVTSEDIKKLAPIVRRQTWCKLYTNISGKDVEAMSLLLDLAARTAKLDKLSKKVVSRTIWKYYDAKMAKPPQDLLEAVNSTVAAVNASLTVVRDGFLDAVTRFANHNATSVLVDAIQRNDLSKHLIFLMLSPVEDLHVAAQTFIGQAYDVDVRVDCFREILKAQPKSSFTGLCDYISDFNSYAVKVTEACNVSKALVRCMTDVLEVMGNSPDGLLKDRKYVNKNTTENFSLRNELPKLWKVMTVSIAVIFRRTPKWAVYFDNSTMTEWMRDALIFARDLLDHRRTFEAASSDEDTMGSPSKPSSVGKTMVEDLQDVLLELLAWLRLTDTELLYQSFALLKSLFQCFRAVDIKPSPEALAKLSKLIQQNKATKDSKRVTYLNRTDLAELEIAVEEFTKEDDDSDEAEIISVSWKPKGKRKSTDRISSPEVEEIEGLVARKKQRTDKEPIPIISKAAPKSTKQAKLPFSDKSSLKSLLPKRPQKVAKPIIKPTAQTSTKRGPKFEGSSVPRSVASGPSRPASSSSSSSSSSESDESDDDGIAYLTKPPKKPSPKKEARRLVERPKIKVIEDPNLRQARLEAEERLRRQEEMKRTALRLKPDVTSLHLAILSWNYDHEGSDPPMQLPALASVPDSFRNYEDYFRIFRPLLMLEAWSQIVKSKEETTPDIFLTQIDSRSFQPPWLDLDVSLLTQARPEWRLNPETDIVLLRHITQKIGLMAKVTSFRKGSEGIMFGLRCCTRALDADPGLSVGSRWHLNVVFSLTTLHREYAALIALPYYDLVDIILRPRLSDPIVASSQEVQQAMKGYRVNEPQAKAIISAMSTKGFTLIQGPPGTGKTWTICGLVGAFLSSRRTAPTRIALPGSTAQQNGKLAAQKLLICAPSNAAVDEITKRLIGGIYGSSGQQLKPKVVRVGSESQINISAKEFSLDSLVDARMNSDGGNATFGDSVAEAKSVRAEIDEVKAAKQKKMEELQSTVNNASRALSLEDEINMLNAKRIALSQKLDQLRDKMKSQNRSNDALRRRYRTEILAEADVICSTLSGAGHEQLEPFDFSMVIIDEASQSIELSSLIPLKYQSTRCIMVGDPQQLPPTVLSPEASRWGYDQSLFVRMQKHRPEAVHLLSIQYRMHPEISLLPSKVFYGGRLQDGPDMDKKTAQPWHADPRFGPYRFYSVEQGREEPGRIGHSLLNRDECRMIIAFYDRLRKQFPFVDFDYRVGIVTMYRSQVQELRNTFRQRFGAQILTTVDFNTVDGFQGQEKDIIILSCVRAGTSLSTVGFLSDIRRMNVAITRSKSSLFIFGHAPTLQRSNKVWKDIIDDARSRSCFVELRDTSYFISSMLQIRGAASRQSQQVQETPEPELFSPKSSKTATTRKIPRDVRVVDTGHTTDIATVSSDQNTEVKEKPMRNEEQDLRSQPDEKRTKTHSAPTEVARPLTLDDGRKINSIDGLPSGGVEPTPAALKQSAPQTGPRPFKVNGQDAVSERAAAQKQLEAFRRRKKDATNPFIKR